MLGYECTVNGCPVLSWLAWITFFVSCGIIPALAVGYSEISERRQRRHAEVIAIDRAVVGVDEDLDRRHAA